MDFIDEAKIYIQSGDGGKGCISFRREKYIPRGGPDGGSGGRGGDVIFRTNPQLWTLQDFKYQQHYRAKDGKQGGGQQKTGRSAESCLVEVPVGTLVWDIDLGEVIADLSEPGVEFVVAEGGRGGRGNMQFKSSTNRAPRRAEMGEPGITRTLRLELKILADVSLVGFPNAGKSTLVSAISGAVCRAADYPFTTLTPQLGHVRGAARDEGLRNSFVVADIPGLIEGAHAGRGLGIRFLRHIERSSLLWFVIDVHRDEVQTLDPAAVYETLINELREFQPALLEKPRMVVFNKIDLEPLSEKDTSLFKMLKKEQIPYFFVSALQRQGLATLVEATLDQLREIDALKSAPSTDESVESGALPEMSTIPHP